MDGKKYLYRGRILSVQQTLSDLLFGVISSDPLQYGFGSDHYRWVKNRDLGRYKTEEEAQAALDAFAKKHKLPRKR